MQKTMTKVSSRNVSKKKLFKKRDKRAAVKTKVDRFASSFYAQYGEIMSRLSHE
jgi:hypothetical protein